MLAALPLASAAAAAQPPKAAELPPRLERMPMENVLEFWYPQTLDREHGGYRLNHCGRGEWRPRVDERLRARGGKAGEWKAAYHSRRAMVECLAILRGLS